MKKKIKQSVQTEISLPFKVAFTKIAHFKWTA